MKKFTFSILVSQWLIREKYNENVIKIIIINWGHQIVIVMLKIKIIKIILKKIWLYKV